MTKQGGVKTVALGGRPGGGITQAIGGVKGTNDLPYINIFYNFAEVYASSNASLQSSWESSVINQYTALPFYASTNVVINARNGYAQGDTSQTPLQFVYEPADCRILYTPAMVVDETAVWKTVADSAWGGGAGNACVAGGLSSETKKRSRAARQLHEARSDTNYRAILDSLSVQTQTWFENGFGSSFMRP